MKKFIFLIKFTLLVAIVILLGACSKPAPPSISVLKPDPAAIAAIRNAGATFDSAVEVQPLRDPALDGWLQQAHELEAQGKYEEALVASQHALALAKDAPDVLQYQAELQLELQRYKESSTLAQQSYAAGPKVGSLCARNSQTLIEIGRVLNDSAAIEQAKRQLENCRIARPVRM